MSWRSSRAEGLGKSLFRYTSSMASHLCPFFNAAGPGASSWHGLGTRAWDVSCPAAGGMWKDQLCSRRNFCSKGGELVLHGEAWCFHAEPVYGRDLLPAHGL